MLRKKKAESEKAHTDAMHIDLVCKDGISFWKSWDKLNGPRESPVTRVNGETDPKNIAETFATYFESVYSNHDTPQHSKLKNNFEKSYENYFTDHIDDNITPYLLSWSEMIDLISKIKPGKASSGICRPEHILLGSPELLCHLHLLFNGLLQHGYVPANFLQGTITPIVKDSQGDLSDPSNYRGITLSCLPAKLFELAIQMKTSHLLGTNELQFGFKSRTSTNHALYAMKSTVDHFLNHGSNVYVAFLDCTKAFDRISHHGLFSKLISRNIPLCILLCLIYWYSNMKSCVRWGDQCSRSFRVPLGIKQGGINSPNLFSCYIDDLSYLLQKMNIGCHLFNIFLAMILFADDICLLAPTRAALDKLIQKSAEYCNEFGLSFNAKKSKILVFSKTRVNHEQLLPIFLNGDKIEYCDTVKYLGAHVVTENGISFSASSDLASFYRASNSILRAINKPSDEILIHLLYSNCIPILTYACAVKQYSTKQMQECNTAVNNALRLIFGYNRWESIRSVRESFGYKSLTELFAIAKRRFDLSLPRHHNKVISHLARNLAIDVNS